MPRVSVEQLRMSGEPPPLHDLGMMAAWARLYIDEHPEPDLVIGRNNSLQRWFLVPRNDTANVYLHRFLGSDEDRALHDHPFDNTSWILDGEYLEHSAELDGKPYATLWSAGSRVERTAEQPHRIELISGPAITLFFTGFRRREWGFHCPQGWRHWREFSDPSDYGKMGRGCE